MVMDNVVVELGSFGTYTCPLYMTMSLSLPFVRSEHACSKLSEGLDHCIIVVCTSPDAFHQLITSAVHKGGLCVTNLEHLGGE